MSMHAHGERRVGSREIFAPAEYGVTKITVLCSPDPTIWTKKRSGRVFIILQAVAADDLDRDPHFPLS